MNTAVSSPLRIRMPGSGDGNPQNGGPVAKKILVIDDNIVFLKAMSLKLRSCGYDVMTAVDGAAVLVDMALLEVCRPPVAARSSEKTSNQPGRRIG